MQRKLLALKEELLSRAGYAAMAYALLVLCCALYNLCLYGWETTIYARFFVQALLLILAVQGVDMVCCRLFEKALPALIVSFALDLIAVLGLCLLFSWANSIRGLAAAGAMTALIFLSVNRYAYARNRAAARRINQKLKDGQLPS